ncbi:hypothetical protein MRB53_004482 [Persea americana]|uniref:Uncharacterized protein n=1 Tax=Persea americana TaxID=3435 RepID=A0ACC2MBJ7_PERAE|nr:hypothetical protein MRB53_004482 [Persea americana]
MLRRRDHDEEEHEDKYEEVGLSKRRCRFAEFFDLEAAVDSDEEEVGEDGIHLFYLLAPNFCNGFLFFLLICQDFINDAGAEIPGGGGRMRCPPLLPREDEEEDVEDLQTRIQERYKRSSHKEYDEETTDVVDQQALLPSVKDPRLWKVECLMGREKEAVVSLMQFINKGSELQIRSAGTLDHLKSNIFIEADKEAHVEDACRGLCNIFPAMVRVVPIKEMTNVLSVETKMVDLAAGSWVRLKIGKYKGDPAKVVNVDSVKQKVRVKLIPTVDLQAIASKMDGRDVVKRKAFLHPPCFINIEKGFFNQRQDPSTGEDFYLIDYVV